MIIEFNISIVGDLTSRTAQVIAIAKHTKTNNPVVQSTTTREMSESEESFINRLRANIRALITPYGYDHHVVLHCRDIPGTDVLTNDKYQNTSRKLWYISKNSSDHAERVNALSLIAEMNFAIHGL